ncbi:MAG: helix-turn-helix transcriptional regulator [Rhodobacteraceae bacterium]|nr:helix-turn-helix transcriptional regulator [Paracoccaceae bacterium]
MTQTFEYRGETAPDTLETDTDVAVAALITRVGERVRKAREQKGIPRRVLSEMSGVSPRYLAQLEAGDGNISIGLLQRVASALEYRIESLMGEDDPPVSDAERVSQVFSGATVDVQDAVMRLLDLAPVAAMRARRVCLVGLRGAGKSTLGALAGQKLGLPFVELNREIEEQSGMPVDEVIALYGQEGYRKLEAQALGRVIATHESLILAVAGGIVADAETFGTLLAHFHTVWVKTSPAEHMTRVRAQGDERPMAGNPEAMEQLKSILTSREALYEQAKAQLDTSGQTVDQSITRLLGLVENRRFLE